MIQHDSWPSNVVDELPYPILHPEDRVNAFGKEVILPVQRVIVIGMVQEG
jgi:hypothetical protein